MEKYLSSILVWTGFQLVILVSTQDVTYTIKEEIPVNSLIGNIGKDTSVVDRVSIDNMDALKYSILTTGNSHAKLFSVNPDQGDLTSASRIDREKLCPFTSLCSVSLEIAVRSETNFFSFEVKIVIEDTNDNNPAFPVKSIKLEISESSQLGEPFSFAGAVDNDTEKNSIISYSLLPETVPFSVDFTKNLDGTSTVSIVVKEELDREKTAFYYLTLLAKDGGSPQKTGSMFVNVTILDSNDNSPQFTFAVYNATLKENAPVNTSFVRVKANDRDAGNNSKVFYRLSSHQPEEHLHYFSVDSTSGDMKVQVAPPSGHIRVIVEASDKGRPPKVAQAFVDITVLDTKNQRPSITVNLFNGIAKAHISEFKKPGYAFAHVKIFDPDTGRNGNVTCQSQTDIFSLQQLNIKEYTVIVASNLDRENTSKYTVVIFCEDDGQPKLNATATFDVEIDDENDNAPEFLQTVYEISIPENNAVNDTILQVAATDKDSGINSQISFKISQEGQPYFFFQPDSSVIRVRISFDREKKSEYTFEVLAVDGGTPRLTSTAEVKITIIDLNDERPKFDEESYTFYIEENSSVGSVIGDVRATDRDSGSGGTFSLVLSSSYKSKPLPFTVLQNGTIVSTEPLDAEAESIYQFQVIATDHALSPLIGIANVQVLVTDQNEHEPYFMFPNNVNNSIIIFAPRHSGRAILWVQAYDDDVDDADDLVYSLMDKNDSGIFKINTSTGQIVLIKDVGEADVGYYELQVTASDKHDPPRFHSETLKVVIKFKPQQQAASDSDHYIIIVIAIVCVTAVVAAAVLVTLCYLRKHDKDMELKRSFSCRSEKPKVQVPVVYDETSRSENIKTPLHDLNPSLRGGSVDKTQTHREMYRSDTFTDLSHDSVRTFYNTKHTTHNSLVEHANINGRTWMDGLKQAEDFQSSSSGEVTNGDSGHGSDDDFTFQDGSSQSPRTFKHGLRASDVKSYSRQNQSPRSVSSFSKQHLTHQTGSGHNVTAERQIKGHNQSYSPSHGFHNNRQNVPVNSDPRYSFRQFLDLSKDSSVGHPQDISSNRPVPSSAGLSRPASVPARSGYSAADFHRLPSRGHHPHQSVNHVSPGSDDDTTTSGSYSVTLDDIRTDLNDVGLRIQTDAYV